MEQFVASWEDHSQEAFLLGKNPRRAQKLEIVKRVAQLKANASCDRFPTDVNRLAQEIGIAAVRDVPMAVRGCLVRQPGGFAVELNADLTALDRRFVLAHEICHLLIEREQLLQAAERFERGATSGTLGYKQTEQLCDFGAREILLPLNSLRAELRAMSPDLELVVRVAAEAECSVEVAVAQICEPIMLWECTFIFWKELGSLLTAHQVFPATAREIEIADPMTSLVRKALQSQKIVAGREKLDLIDRIETPPAQAVRIGSGSALLMVHGTLW